MLKSSFNSNIQGSNLVFLAYYSNDSFKGSNLTNSFFFCLRSGPSWKRRFLSIFKKKKKVKGGYMLRKCKRTFSANPVEVKRTLRFSARTRFNIEPATNNLLLFHEYSNIQRMGKLLFIPPNSWKIIIFFHKFSLLIRKCFQVKQTCYLGRR